MKYMRDQKLIYSSKVTKYTLLHGLTIFILLLIAAALLWINYSSESAKLSDPPVICFEGEYRIDDGPWKPLDPDTHISSTRGDVTLKGYFFQRTSEGSALDTGGLTPVKKGTLIAMYSNHIQIEVPDPRIMFSLRGKEEMVHTVSSCGKFWTIFKLEEAEARPVTIVLKNPHRFGNENAVDELLESFTVYLPNEFEQGMREIITPEKILGLIYVIMAIIQLGAALFSILLKFGDLPVFSMSGFAFFFAGGMFLFGSPSMHFQNQQIIMNTTFLGICLILYVFFMTALSACFLHERWKKAGHRLVAASGVLTAATFLVPMVSGMLFYDIWFWWASLQVFPCLTMAYLLIRSIPFMTGYHRLNSIVFLLVMLALMLDYTAVSMGWWSNIYVSKALFSLLFVGLTAVLIWKMPKNIHAAAKARELEKQQIQLQSKLQETRVAIMISQIKPHFIYNTLGTIEQLCLEDPEGASRLVHNFSLYLRGNFSELDSKVPIRFSRELDHVKYYTEIEQIRFPDMTIVYDIGPSDFLVPALSLQPLVENAIKHGLMGLEEGGTVTISTFETEDSFCIRVVDDGVGFDAERELDEKKHIGIRNIRERIEMMCGGTLTITSSPGCGTAAAIEIPRFSRGGVKKNGCNYSR